VKRLSRPQTLSGHRIALNGVLVGEGLGTGSPYFALLLRLASCFASRRAVSASFRAPSSAAPSMQCLSSVILAAILDLANSIRAIL